MRFRCQHESNDSTRVCAGTRLVVSFPVALIGPLDRALDRFDGLLQVCMRLQAFSCQGSLTVADQGYY
jgi:hypothetical protein